MREWHQERSDPGDPNRGRPSPHREGAVRLSDTTNPYALEGSDTSSVDEFDAGLETFFVGSRLSEHRIALATRPRRPITRPMSPLGGTNLGDHIVGAVLDDGDTHVVRVLHDLFSR